VEIDEGERLAQVVFHKMELLETMEVDELPKTERGESGYGSTGK
jgi:dUTP pyrophosphatase